MKDVYEYDDVEPPRFGPPAKLSDDSDTLEIIKTLKSDKEFNQYLERVITRVVDKLIKQALK